MDYKFKMMENQLVYVNDEEQVSAYIDYNENDTTLDILRVYVSDALRGQGIASKLMEEIYAYVTQKGKKINPICTYAKSWIDNKK